MTIAEKLYNSDPLLLFNILSFYELVGLMGVYFPDAAIDPEIKELMSPSIYSGRVERRHGALRQAHRLILK